MLPKAQCSVKLPGIIWQSPRANGRIKYIIGQAYWTAWSAWDKREATGEGKKMDREPRETEESEKLEAQPSASPGNQPEGEAARAVAVRSGLVGMLHAEHADLSNGAALLLVAGEGNLQRAGSIITVARNLSLRQSGSQWLLAGNAHLEQSGSGIMISPRVDAPNARAAVVLANSFQGNAQVGVLLARNVEGNVQALVDTAAAVRLGAAFVAALGIALLLRRLLGGR